MKVYKAGLYLRLTHEDIQEYNSIEAQRTITIEYANNHGFNIIEEYIDNGYSGILDSRPALNKAAIRNKIDC